MNILVLAKLADSTLHTFIEPIAEHNNNGSVFMLRDTPYQSSAKNVFNVYSKPLGKTRLRHFKKIITGTRCIVQNKIDLIVSIHLYPHGYIGRLLSVMTRKPLIHVVIGGKREFFVYGKFIETINHYLFRNIQLISVTGSLTNDYLLANNHLQKHIVLLPNVIRADMFYPLECSKNYDIVFAARIDKNKNIVTFLRALTILKGKGKRLKVAVTGYGAEQKLKSLINDMKLEDTIAFLGWLNYEDVPLLYNRSKIFVLTSMGEGCPLALLEAMSCGVPPICTAAGDIPDVVHHKKNGLILEDAFNESKLAEYIELLLDDESLYERLSENAKKVREQYSIEASVVRWKQIVSLGGSAHD